MKEELKAITTRLQTKTYIYQEGYEAALAGLSRNSNAYKGLEKIMWYQGFDTGLVFIYELANGGY